MSIKTVEQLEIIDDNLMKSIYDEVIKKDNNIHNQLNECLKNGYTPIIFEAMEYNIYTEYMAMTKNFKKGISNGTFEQGFYKVLEFMINCIIADPINGNYYEQQNSDLLKEGGRLLNITGDMEDDLVWYFVPNKFKRDIDVSWDGIGGWQS
jgi:hypothetical protein